MGVVIYAGTARGVIELREQCGEWTIGRRHFMPQWEITQLLTLDNDMLMASTRGDGVWVQLDRKGEGMAGGWVKPNYGRPGPGKTHAIAIDPEDRNTVYAGTEPIGIWVTHDAGSNWEPLTSLWNTPGVQQIDYPVPFVEPHVRHIAIDPNDRNVLYASLQVGFVAKSTDRGATWRVIEGGIDADVHTIVIDPKNSNRLFAATGGHDAREGRAKGKALYKSEDAGETWAPMATDFQEEYAVPIVMQPNNSDVLFSSLAVGPAPFWRRPEGAKGRFICTRDGGANWQQVRLPDDRVGQEFPGAISFDPEDSEGLYMSTNRGALYRSCDSGETWDRLPINLEDAGELTEIGLSDIRIFHL